MARYIGPVCKLCRREGMKLYLKGDRCFSEKCSVNRRPYPPGQHGQGRIKMSEYGLRLREKQKVRRIYGVLEAQFRNTFAKAVKMKGITGENLLSTLERRLDSVIYRMGLGASRSQARQIVRHGHIQVNARKVDIPSFIVKPGDEISVKESSKNNPTILSSRDATAHAPSPSWMDVDRENLKGRINSTPRRDELVQIPINEQLIVELYSK
jgi:small subunit ribosomal protein S4